MLMYINMEHHALLRTHMAVAIQTASVPLREDPNLIYLPFHNSPKPR